MMTVLQIIDYHVAGEPLRIVGPRKDIPGKSMAEKAQAALALLARDRALATQEPRGHRDTFAAFLTDPVSPGADFGALICDGDPASPFKATCGHGSIALATAALEQGWITPRPGNNTVSIDVPAGLVRLEVSWDGTCCGTVRYRHVLSHVITPEVRIGPLCGALVSAGPAVLLVDAAAHKIEATPRAAFRSYSAIRDAAVAQHQTSPDLVQFIWPQGPGTFRSLTFFGATGYDRSPCGTGSAALITWLAETEAANEGDTVTNTTLFGTSFDLSFHSENGAIRPEIRARAFRTGTAQLILAEDDPLGIGLTPPDLF